MTGAAREARREIRDFGFELCFPAEVVPAPGAAAAEPEPEGLAEAGPAETLLPKAKAQRHGLENFICW